MAEAASLIDILQAMGGAFLLALPIAFERERSTQLMGLRTFPLVAVGAAAFLLAGSEFAAGDPDAQARIAQGVIGGIGFIGGGAILKEGGSVQGTATAASLWATGALGMAAAYARWDIAVSLSAFLFLTLILLTRLEKKIEMKADAADD